MSVLSKRELFQSPEIDAVRQSLEFGVTEIGDHLSDRYWALIDTATDPRVLIEPLEEQRRRRVVRIVSEFQANANFVERTLAFGADRYEIPNLHQMFDSVIEQCQLLVGIDTQAPEHV